MTLYALGRDEKQRPPTADFRDIAEEYLLELAAAALSVDSATVAELATLLVNTVSSGHAVFTAGNGGSAAAAEHMASDWQAAFARRGQRPCRIVALTDNLARLTALANDVSYDDVFTQRLWCEGQAGDILILLSVSGDSANLVSAAQTARELGMTVAGIVGRGGALARHCDLLAVVGNGDYGLAEDLHLAINHTLVRILNGGRPLLAGTFGPRPDGTAPGERG